LLNTILVTGGCGFIGSHFVHLLLERMNWRVVNLDGLTYAGNLNNLKDVEQDPHYRFIKGDVTDAAVVDQLFREEGPQFVVNFAAESHVDRSILDSSPFLKTNILGVQVLLEAARSHGVERFVQISTDEVYGDVEGEEPCPEASPLRPSSPYASSKASADLLSLAYRRTYGLPVIIVRSANNYGPFQFPEKLVPLLIANALSGAELPVYGDGLQQRDWLYVRDNTSAILQVLENGLVGSVYNIGTGEDRANLEVVQTICRLLAEETGVDPESLLSLIKFVADRPGHDRRYALDTQKIRQELGWEPQLAFEPGMRHTIRWYLEHQDWVREVTSGAYLKYYEAVYSQKWGQSA
jgi:dTDP-glucose 4,6-dehydratase